MEEGGKKEPAPVGAPAARAADPHPEPTPAVAEPTQSAETSPVTESVGEASGTPSKAGAVFRDAASSATSVFQRLSIQARDAAIVAGQKLDQATISVGAAIDNYAIQIGHAYDQHVSKELAHAVEGRERHRQAQESNVPPERQEQIIMYRSELVEQCVTLTGDAIGPQTSLAHVKRSPQLSLKKGERYDLYRLVGDIQQEIQYATKEAPLGRESYGLMMLCNVMVPILEHGLRQDWKSVLPAATMLSSSSRWAQSLVKQARGAQPTAFDVLQAADQGWQAGQSGGMGVVDLPLQGVQGARRVQAWLYDSLNKGLLAGRMQSLMLMQDLMEDWYFSWALLRTEGALQDVLVELVKIESQQGLIELPLDQLLGPASNQTYMKDWNSKMRDTFNAMAGRAREASKVAYSKASEGYSRVATAVRNDQQGAASPLASAPGPPASTGTTAPAATAVSPPTSVAPAAAPADAGAAGMAASSPAGAAAAEAGLAAEEFQDPAGEDDEDALIVHAGFGMPQQPLGTTSAGAPVFLGLDDEDDGEDAAGGGTPATHSSTKAEGS